MTTVSTTGAAAAAPSAQPKYGFAAMGSADFIKLLTTQLSQQDPTDPVDNKEMLAQMAQFSSLSGISETNSTLRLIADKLDAVISAQESAAASLAVLTPPAA